MKNLLKAGVLSFLVLASCSKDDNNNQVTNPPTENPITAEVNLLVIDTSKINTISKTGTNEKTIINRIKNTSSFIGDFSVNAQSTKFVYVDNQRTFSPNVYTAQLRVADISGANDKDILSTTTDEILHAKFCSDGKIHFARKNRTTNTLMFGTINSDGTGLNESTGYYPEIVDITSDRKLILLAPNTLSSTGKVQVIDLSLDGGAGGPFHTENFTGIDPYQIKEGVFTPDGKKAIIPFKDGNDIKIRVIDLSTKTSTTKTIATGITEWAFFHAEIAKDNNTGVLGVMGGNFPTKSKTYMFSLDSNTTTSFENNDENIVNIYPY